MIADSIYKVFRITKGFEVLIKIVRERQKSEDCVDLSSIDKLLISDFLVNNNYKIISICNVRLHFHPDHLNYHKYINAPTPMFSLVSGSSFKDLCRSVIVNIPHSDTPKPSIKVDIFVADFVVSAA